MNIGILSSYGIKCGIAEYSIKLYQAFTDLGHSVTIFGNYGGTAIRESMRWMITSSLPDIQAVPCFYAPAWCVSHTFDLQLLEKEIDRRQIELIIVQYQNGIIHDQPFLAFLKLMEKKNIKVIVAFHDSCLGPALPFHLIRYRVTLSKQLQQMIPQSIYIPGGVPEPPHETKDALRKRYGITGPVVSTFGLGRTDYQLISDVCLELGFKFMVLDSTGSCRINPPHLIRSTEWYPLPELINRLAVSDAIVLWYHDIDAYVSSSAVRNAIASRRPVIVNDVSWFTDISEPIVTKVKTKDQLAVALKKAVAMDKNPEQEQYIRENSWTAVANKYLYLIGEME